MKNPKWREAYPARHKLKYGGKFLTSWTGYGLTLLPSEYGTISGDKLRGYEDDICHFTAYPTTLMNEFQGYDLTGAGYIQGNNYIYTNGPATAQGRFANNTSALIYSGDDTEKTEEEVKITGTLPTDCWIALKYDRKVYPTSPSHGGDYVSAKFSYNWGNQSHTDPSAPPYNIAAYVDGRPSWGLGEYVWQNWLAPDWKDSDTQGVRDFGTYVSNGGYISKRYETSVLYNTKTVCNKYLSASNQHSVKLICPYSGKNSYFYIDNVLEQTRTLDENTNVNVYSAWYNWHLHDWSGHFNFSVGMSTEGENIEYDQYKGEWVGTWRIKQRFKNYQVAVFKDLSAAQQW